MKIILILKKLALELPGYTAGGPRVYFFSIYPSFQAILFWIIKNNKLFLLVNHLITIFLSAGAIAIFFKIVIQVVTLRTSIIACALVFFHPLFLSQSYAINMEIPVLFCGLLSVYFYSKENKIRTIIFLYLCFSIKTSGVLFSLAIGISALLTEYKNGKNKKFLILYFLPCFLYFFQVYITNTLFLDPENDLNISLDLSIYNIISTQYRMFKKIPDLYILLIEGIIGTFGLLIPYFVSKKIISANNIKENSIIFLSGIFILSIFMLTIIIRNFLSRYLLISYPLIVLSVIWSLERMKPRIVPVMSFILLSFYFFNMYGLLYQNSDRSGSLYERTLEYEYDMKANLELIKLIEKKYTNKIIVTSWPIAQMLISPKFCYVKQKKEVITFGRNCFSYKGVKNIKEIDLNNSEIKDQLIWVWSKSVFWSKNGFDSSKDTLFDLIEIGSRKIYIFQRDLEKNKDELYQWY